MLTKKKILSIEEDIINALKSINKELTINKINNSKEWTRAIKRSIGNLGIRNGYQVCASGFEGSFSNEWLFDIVWYQEDNYLKEVCLIAESEWGLEIGHIKYDFEKLLVGNAYIRLMICNADGSLVENRFSYFQSAIKAFKQLNNGSRFLIAIYNNSEGKFEFKSIVK
jgi:hypothetical protein